MENWHFHVRHQMNFFTRLLLPSYDIAFVNWRQNDESIRHSDVIIRKLSQTWQ
jgi:hypothetical protein